MFALKTNEIHLHWFECYAEKQNNYWECVNCLLFLNHRMTAGGREPNDKQIIHSFCWSKAEISRYIPFVSQMISTLRPAERTVRSETILTDCGLTRSRIHNQKRQNQLRKQSNDHKIDWVLYRMESIGKESKSIWETIKTTIAYN